MEWVSKDGIDSPWHDIEDFGIHIGTLVSVRCTRFVASLETPEPGTSDWYVGEKNGLRSVWPFPSLVLRPEDSKGSGSVLRRRAHLPGSGDPKGLLPKVQESETGEAELAGRQPFLHQEICILRRPRCRDSTITDVARELHLNWKTVKSLEKQYMREQLKRAGLPGPKVIGIDEIEVLDLGARAEARGRRE